MTVPDYTPLCPAGVTELTLTVTAEQTDGSGRMRLDALAHAMELATREQFQSHGWTKQTFDNQNLVWVIAWTSIQIMRLPRENEPIRLRVWAGRKKLSMHVRKYAVYTASGEPLASTASLFLLMDKEKRTLAPQTAAPDFPEVTLPGEAEIPTMRLPFPENPANHRTRTVSAGEIDSNGHMNNACYLAWADELCGPAYRANHAPRSVWVQYTKELKEGQTAALEFGMERDRLLVRAASDGAEAFLAAIQYRKCNCSAPASLGC